MSNQPSNPTPVRRITPGDEAYLRRFRAEMKFTNAGPFARLLDPIRPPKPVRDKAGNVVDPQPRYSATSAESWSIGTRLGAVTSMVVAIFGREYNSVLDEEPPAAAPKRRRRRGSRGGRKVAAS